MADSFRDSLRMAVHKKYDKLDVSQKSVVVYLYLSLCEMFQMSQEVEQVMHKFIELFKQTGVSKYVGDNLLIVQKQVIGVCKRHDSVRGLHSEHVMDVLTGLVICSNTKSRDMIKHLKQTAELNHLSLFLPTIPSDALLIKQIEGILVKANDQYDLLFMAGLW